MTPFRRRRIDRRNYTERSFDTKLVIALAALAAISILWLTKSYFGVGQNAFTFAVAVLMLYGGYLLIFLVVPALIFLCASAIGRLWNKYRSSPKEWAKAILSDFSESHIAAGEMLMLGEVNLNFLKKGHTAENFNEGLQYALQQGWVEKLDTRLKLTEVGFAESRQ
jgi:hypothetical protein